MAIGGFKKGGVAGAHSAHIRIDRIEGQLDRIEVKTEKIYEHLIK